MGKREKGSKKISARRLAANQQNAQKSSGPHNCNLTRWNAAKQGLLAEGVTKIDEPAMFLDYRARLESELKPVGKVEFELVRHIAFLFVRLRHSGVLEAETKRQQEDDPLNALVRELQEVSGLTRRLPDVMSMQKLQRYEAGLENRLYRALNQLERVQRIRNDASVKKDKRGQLK